MYSSSSKILAPGHRPGRSCIDTRLGQHLLLCSLMLCSGNKPSAIRGATVQSSSGPHSSSTTPAAISLSKEAGRTALLSESSSNKYHPAPVLAPENINPALRVLLVSSAFNGMTQRTKVWLEQQGHLVSVQVSSGCNCITSPCAFSRLASQPGIWPGTLIHQHQVPASVLITHSTSANAPE